VKYKRQAPIEMEKAHRLRLLVFDFALEKAAQEPKNQYREV
jgi:hypothetical protein